MKYIPFLILIFITSIFLQAKQLIIDDFKGVWELSSKSNNFTTFGKDTSKRGEKFTLIFNEKNVVKNVTTNSIYNYVIKKNGFKIYQNNRANRYSIRHYDLMIISNNNHFVNNCFNIKIKIKKITGYYKKEQYIFCKIEKFPIDLEKKLEKYHF